MAIFRTRITGLAAGAINNNLLAGSKFEFLSRPAVVSVWASQDGAGAPNAMLDFTLGNVVVGDDLAPNTAATAGNIDRQADGVGSGVGAGGDRIQLRARNADAAGAINLTVLLEINEV